MFALEPWLATFGAIFAIVDPFGYVPIFLSMTASDSDSQRRKMVTKACVAAFVVLTVSIFLGQFILKIFGISIPALQISGGLIMLVIGFEMLKVIPVAEKLTPVEENEAIRKEDISIVPLAIPMLSGPASIATVVIIGSQAKSFMDFIPAVVSILLTLLITYFALRNASRLLQVVGETGLKVMTRIMGLLLCSMAVQYVINGYQAVR